MTGFVPSDPPENDDEDGPRCDVCGETFATEDALHEHIEDVGQTH